MLNPPPIAGAALSVNVGVEVWTSRRPIVAAP
jgi:hypothetical protein